MQPGDLIALLLRRPFQTFRLFLSTGIVHEIRHPELVLVGGSTVTIQFPEKTLPVPVAKSEWIVSLLHIVQVEVVPSPGPNPLTN